MNLQQLEYFSGAYDAGSFSAAAERLHLSQPSVSEQVRRLEDELGVALFQRAGRGLVPTDAGRALRPHADAVRVAVEAARESVVAQRELRGGIATFGTFGTARYYLGTAIVADFRRRHPSVRVRLVGQNSSQVVHAVRDGELEAGLVGLPIDDRGLDVQPIMRDENVYVSAVAEHVARPVTIAGLARAPLILPDVSFGGADPSRRQFNELAQRAGITIEADIEVEDVEAALDLAARGLGDTIVSRGTLLALGRGVSRRLGWVPFTEPVYDTFAFISRRGGSLSPAAREFMGLAEARLLAMAATLETRPPRHRAPETA